MATTVVNVRSGPFYGAYIGRHVWRAGGVWPQSILANPFKIGKDGYRMDVLEQYYEWLLQHPVLLEQLPALRDRALGCWCAPEPCHGHILAHLADNLDQYAIAGWPSWPTLRDIIYGTVYGHGLS